MTRAKTVPVPITEKTVLSIEEAGKLAGCGRSTIYKAISGGLLVARKNRARTMILRLDLERWLHELPAIDPAAHGKKVVGASSTK